MVKTLPSSVGVGVSVPCWGDKILHGSWPKIQSIKFNKDFKNGPHKKVFKGEKKREDFSGGPVVKESACHCRGHWFDPSLGKIPHALRQINPCATITEPILSSSRAATTEPTYPRVCALQQEKPLQ